MQPFYTFVHECQSFVHEMRRASLLGQEVDGGIIGHPSPAYRTAAPSMAVDLYLALPGAVAWPGAYDLEADSSLEYGAHEGRPTALPGIAGMPGKPLPKRHIGESDVMLRVFERPLKVDQIYHVTGSDGN